MCRLKDKAEAGKDAMIAWCRENMVSDKYPLMIDIRDMLPMTATGKILKQERKGELSSGWSQNDNTVEVLEHH